MYISIWTTSRKHISINLYSSGAVVRCYDADTKIKAIFYNVNEFLLPKRRRWIYYLIAFAYLLAIFGAYMFLRYFINNFPHLAGGWVGAVVLMCSLLTIVFLPGYIIEALVIGKPVVKEKLSFFSGHNIKRFVFKHYGYAVAAIFGALAAHIFH